jgi:hypothetical protein
VISAISGSNTSTSAPTLQPGFNETTANAAGPGGLNFIRPPYVQYVGYDVNQVYISLGLSDAVSWQSEYQGAQFQDIRSLSHTTLLYATMLNL